MNTMRKDSEYLAMYYYIVSIYVLILTNYKYYVYYLLSTYYDKADALSQYTININHKKENIIMVKKVFRQDNLFFCVYR